MQNNITRRTALKGAAATPIAAAATAVTAPSTTAEANDHDTSDIAFMEAALAEIGRLEHRWLEMSRAADMADEDHPPEADAIEERAWALGDRLAAYPITSPAGALFKAEAICSGVGPMFRNAWPMMPQHVEAMQETLRDWLASQACLAPCANNAAASKTKSDASPVQLAFTAYKVAVERHHHHRQNSGLAGMAFEHPDLERLEAEDSALDGDVVERLLNLLETPAGKITDLRLKVVALRADTADFRDDPAEEALPALCDDIERLAGGAS